MVTTKEQRQHFGVALLLFYSKAWTHALREGYRLRAFAYGAFILTKAR